MADTDTLPTLPEPQETTPPEAGPAIEIERIDDTPEEDRARPAPAPETYAAVDDESQDAAYSGKVQGRLRQLRHVYHEERRQKEAALREREAVLGYAQSLQAEVEKLRGLVSSGERVLIDQAQAKGEALVASAREAYRRAHDSGDAEEVARAQEQLARAVAEHERYKVMRPSMPPPPPPPPPGQPQQQAVPVPQYQQPQYQQPVAPARDERLEAWVAQHPWWTQPGYDNARRYLRAVDTELKQNGIQPFGATADAYWATVDQQLRDVFPQLAGSAAGNANANGQAHLSPQTRSRPVTATSGPRTSGKPVKVQLKESQIRTAQRLGVTPEQYARELLKMQQQQG